MNDKLEKPEHQRDWFAVDRRVFEHSMFAGEFDWRSAWLWLIANAAWKDHHVRTRGGMFEIKRGEVLVGRDHLAAAWKWTPKRVRNFLAELRSQGMLELGQREGQYASVAKISNYERFQSVGGISGPEKGPAKGQREASEGPHITKNTKKTIVREGARKPTANDDRAVLDRALGEYNRAAEAHRFARCTTLTAQRAKALARRLTDLGQGDLEKGAARFGEALSAIPHDPFLAGKVTPRPGGQPFRLDLERLLSTGSGMGDVLAKLLDIHDEHGPAGGKGNHAAHAINRKRFDDEWREAQAEELAAQRARYHTPAEAMEVPPDFH